MVYEGIEHLKKDKVNKYQIAIRQNTIATWEEYKA